jgi:hypothetical protein
VTGSHHRTPTNLGAGHTSFGVCGPSSTTRRRLVDRVISVILPVRNGMPWLEIQLRALADQRCPEPWEVVVADNGSDDGSREFAEAWSIDHQAFRVVDASALDGAPAARNVGVRAARGDLLAFCDADDIVGEGWLAACVQGLEHADVVAGTFDFWSLNGTRESPAAPAAIRQLGFLPAGLGANLAVRRPAFEEVCGFNEELLLGEDIDLCWRLQLRGFRFVISPDAIVAKRGAHRVQAGVPTGVRLRALRAPALPAVPVRRRPPQPGRCWQVVGLAVVLVAAAAAPGSTLRVGSRRRDQVGPTGRVPQRGSVLPLRIS